MIFTLVNAVELFFESVEFGLPSSYYPVSGLLEGTVVNSFGEINKLSPEKRINLLRNIYHLMSQSGSGLVSEQFTIR